MRKKQIEKLYLLSEIFLRPFVGNKLESCAATALKLNCFMSLEVKSVCLNQGCSDVETR